MPFFNWRLGKRRDDEMSLRPLALRLKLPPNPEYAAQHAQIAADAARDVDDVHLDYSVASISEVDKIIARFHAEGMRADQVGETVFSFGCYVGEVMVRHLRGTWKMLAETDLPNELTENSNLMVIEFPNGTVCNPIGKAFKLLEFGELESLAYFYHVFAAESCT
jgi:hypothetical protein